jgi:hypothetical protein
LLIPSRRAFPPLGCCLGTKPKPGSELPTVLESFSIAHRGDQSVRCERTNSFHGTHALAWFAGLKRGLVLLIECLDFFFQRQQLVVEMSKKTTTEQSQLIGRILEDQW